MYHFCYATVAGFRRKFDGHEQQIAFQVELYSFVLISLSETSPDLYNW